MKKLRKRYVIIAVLLLAAFALWTEAVCRIDVQAIGPQGTLVGFASLNRFVHGLTGVHLWLYTVTDWLSLVPAAFVLGFAILGLSQWINRKSIRKVDWNILILGGFYIAVIAAYLSFEIHVINYRPVLMDGALEASYPSSTTVLVMTAMPTAIMQLRRYMKNRWLLTLATVAVTAFAVFMVIGRLLSGVHWFTDIAGGALLSAGLVTLYYAFDI